MKCKKLIILVSIMCLVLILAALPFVSSCAKPAPTPAPAPAPAPAPKPIKIGALIPFTGPFADYGQFLKEGLEWRLAEANNEVAGRPIEVIIEDSASDTSLSMEKAKKLVEVDKVSIILGPLHSGVLMGLAPYLSENKIIQVGLMTKPLPAGNFGHYIGPYGTLYSDGVPLGMYAYDQLGVRTIITIGSDYVAGKSFVGGAVDTFKEKGGTVVQQQWAAAGTTDFGPFLTAMKEADAVVTWLGSAEQVRFVKQYHEFGLKMPILMVSADQVRSVDMKALGDTIVGAIGSVTYTSRLDNPANKKFVDAFHARFGKDRNPERDVHSAYVAVAMVLDGLAATGGDTTFEKLYAAMLALKVDYPQGSVSVHPSGHSIYDRYIVEAKVIDGEYRWDVIYTYPKLIDPRL